MQDELDYLEETIPKLSDENLIKMITTNANDYRQVAIDFAAAELKERGFIINQTGVNFEIITPNGIELIPPKNSIISSNTATDSSISPEMEDRFLIEERLRLENQLKSGANWFFFIAALSVVNSLILLLGGALNFIIGLGITQIVSAFASELGPIGKGIAFIMSVIVAAVFVLFGALARKRQKWAFVVGMILYAFDGLLFLLVQDWLSIAFHLFALYGIYKGLQALDSLGRLEAEKSTNPLP